MPSSVLIAIALIAAFTSTASAQILSVYGTYSPFHLTNASYSTINNFDGTTTFHTGEAWGNSVNLGATLKLYNFGPASLGLDLRGSPKKFGNPGASNVFAGLKVNVKLPVTHIKPYVQGSVGRLYLRTTASTTNNYGYGPGVINTFTQSTDEQATAYEFMAGADYPLAHFIDIRMVELGVARAGSSAFTRISHTLLLVNTGIVVHF
jgi:hypothetical protein